MEVTHTETIRTLLDQMPCDVRIPPYLDEGECADRGAICVPSERRRFVRRKLRTFMLCETSTSLPSIPRPRDVRKVCSLDVSRGGFRFLTTQQLYPGETISLWSLVARYSCEVARCLKHNDQCYEVGVMIQK